MGQVIPLRQQSRNRDVEKALRVLLHKAETGELTGFAFIAVKTSGLCAGRVNIHNDEEAIEAARRLIDAILGRADYFEPIDKS